MKSDDFKPEVTGSNSGACTRLDMSLLGREWRIDEDNIPRLALARVTPHTEPDHQEVYALRASHLVALALTTLDCCGRWPVSSQRPQRSKDRVPTFCRVRQVRAFEKTVLKSVRLSSAPPSNSLLLLPNGILGILGILGVLVYFSFFKEK